MQAVMSSDVAIAQFSFLELLLLVHGHWCYRRISSMICYFFSKNVVFDITLFLYEEYTSFSAQPANNDWCLSLYNVFFTSLPAIALEVFDQDVSGSISTLLSQVPITLPRRSPSVLFSWRRIIAWMFNGLCTALIIFFIRGGIALWYLFLLAYGAMPPSLSTTTYKVFVECLAPAPCFWIVTIFVVISAMIPYFAYAAIQMRFFPMYHGMIQWMRLECRTEDPE